MQKLIVLSGLPYCGKTFLRNKLKDIYVDLFVSSTNFFAFSTDDYVEEVAKYRGVSYESIFKEVYPEALLSLEENLLAFLEFRKKEDYLVVWDQKNLSFEKRDRIVTDWSFSFKEVEYHAILPARSFEEKKEIEKRKETREKIIPEDVLESMQDSYLIPGADTLEFPVFHYNVFGNLVGEAFRSS